MIIENHKKINHLAGEVVDLGRSKGGSPNHDLFLEFVRLYYSQASYEDLKSWKLNDLLGMVEKHWLLMVNRKPLESNLVIYNTDPQRDQWYSEHTIIQVVTDNMPFLVDSMRMEIERLGMSTHLMIYMGGMQVVRDPQGVILNLSGYDDADIENATIEAPIYIEIDRHTDPESLQMLEDNLRRVIADVYSAVNDWQLMRSGTLETIENLKKTSSQIIDAQELDDSVAYLEWLLEDHFTYLGMRDYVVNDHSGSMSLDLVPGSGLGVLSDDSESRKHRLFSDLPEQARRQLLSTKSVLVISKTNTQSTIHRPGYTDYLGIKHFNDEGELIGERRFIGLYTSTAYATNPADIPFLRKKVANVIKATGLPEKSHSGKDLMHILTTFPRDDLFQASVKELLNISLGVLHLQDRRQIRLFARYDAYGRYVSCMVYMPRDIFSTSLINKMHGVLLASLAGIEASFTIDFSSQVLARINFIVRIDPCQSIAHDLKAIEEELVDVAQSWFDKLVLALRSFYGEEQANVLVRRYAQAFPAGYRDINPPQRALQDIRYIEQLSSEDDLGIDIYRPFGVQANQLNLKMFHEDEAVPLSDIFPILNNMGLQVIDEQSHELLLASGKSIVISEYSLGCDEGADIVLDQIGDTFKQAFLRVWRNDYDDDEFNCLVLAAKLESGEINMLRSYAKYLQQTNFTYSPQYIAVTLIKHVAITRNIVRLFHARFDPSVRKSRKRAYEQLKETIINSLDEVRSLDEDRILSRLVAVIEATVRTNYYQKNKDAYRPYLSFKLDSCLIPDLPKPFPKIEIYVYSKRFEGIHLRADKVARGGLRWSDRREDFRVEVLGLMKAQQVKNALIVPAGAKGGFITKQLSEVSPRSVRLQEGISCYQSFINGLLDCVDNIVEGVCITPDNTICYDGEDAYLVVAADKGTATFSDIANKIAMQRNYWLSDAFASGGSTGYDHKKMGITAKGAWVSAQRLFQELECDVDHADIRVLGIGDMAGDVFGNGLLMSHNLRLVAAFNHRHIFLDPNPDPQQSFVERMRLFTQPGSAWSDYNHDLISAGGGVYSRDLKSITLTPEVKKLLAITDDALMPNELIRAILKAQVDLIWNGGIGTFVKSSQERHDEVGDRNNDTIRIDASELQARVVCEGGNLGFTQLARIEFNKNGGKMNTDFIDNSAGVDCSDHEVNIKILLSDVINAGQLTLPQRNQFLGEMTEEVSKLVLANNYEQNRLIGQNTYVSAQHINLYEYCIAQQEELGYIDRALEFLPTAAQLQERRANGKGLLRPEIAILVAYSKNILAEKLRSVSSLDQPYVYAFVERSLPDPLRKKYSRYIKNHRLYKAIVVTQLSNQMVTDMGATFIYQMQHETGVDIEAIVNAYVIVREIFSIESMMDSINAHDHIIPAIIQYEMTEDIVSIMRRAIRWFLRHRIEEPIDVIIARYKKSIQRLYRRLNTILKGEDKEVFESYRDRLMIAGVSEKIATRIALTLPMYHALNIVEASQLAQTELNLTAKVYFLLVNRLNLIWFREKINHYSSDNQWVVLAKSSYKADLDVVQRKLTLSVISFQSDAKSLSSKMNQWQEQHRALLARWEELIKELRNTDASDFAVVSVAVRELSELAKACYND